MFATLIRILTGVQARWIDSHEPIGAVPQRIYFANHRSNLDAPTIWAALPKSHRVHTRPVAAQDYWTRGRLRRYLASTVMRVVLIERNKVTRDNNPLSAMEHALTQGDSLILFPEGTRSMSDDGAVSEFRPGIFHLARRFPSVQLVPVYLENLNRILPKGELILVPLIAAARFGPPIGLLHGETKPAFLARARSALIRLRDGGSQ